MAKRKAKKAAPKAKAPVRCGIIGYGGAFNMGRAHANWINEIKGMTTVAVCDLDPVRLEVAKEELGDVATFTDVGEMLAQKDLDLVVVVTPHNTHAALAIQAAEAGKHVIVEKPMCITVEEATNMIEAARKNGVMLSVFHNRRYDGDFMTLKSLIDDGVIGEVFQIEVGMGGYRHPGYWWRSNKEISGGAFYDWGAHIVDWVLNLVPQKIAGVTGFFYKLVWRDVTNEDHCHAVVRFENGVAADIQISHLDRIGRPRWRILGTKGAIVDTGEKKFKVNTTIKKLPAEMYIPYKESTWNAYYKGIADHLLRGKPLHVTPESARRVIGVIEAAERSSASGKMEPVPYEDEC